MRMRRSALGGLAAGVVLALAVPAQARNDLRSFRVGMPVADLPASGYRGFACTDAPDIHLKDWSGYITCPKDKLGLHSVSFRYSESSNPRGNVTDAVHGTRVGGHPVLLSLLIGDDGRVDGLRIATDPSAHLYLRKKAFLLGHQVQARYGLEGWHCTNANPHGDEAPIGGMFIDRTCDKDTHAREVTFQEQLFRRAGEPLGDFVSATEVTILAR